MQEKEKESIKKAVMKRLSQGTSPASIEAKTPDRDRSLSHINKKLKSSASRNKAPNQDLHAFTDIKRI